MENNKTKLNEDQLVNETPIQAQPIPATQSEIAQATNQAPVAQDPFTTNPEVAPEVIEDVATTTPEVTPTDTSAPADPFTPPAPGMIPSGWINPEDLAAAVAQATGDVEAAQTAPDATVTTEPVVDNTIPPTQEPAPANNIAAPVQPAGNTLQMESLSDDERRIIEKYRALKEASNKVDELIHDAPNDAAEECKKNFDDIIDAATSNKIPESVEGKSAFGDHPTDKDLEVGTKNPQGKYRGDKKGTDGDFESQDGRVKDDNLNKGLHPDAIEMATALHESEDQPESEGELEEDLGEVTGQLELEKEDIERAMEGNMPESEDIDIAPDVEDQPESESDAELGDDEETDEETSEEDKEEDEEEIQLESEEVEEEEQPESEDTDEIVNDEAIDAIKDEVADEGLFNDTPSSEDMDALSKIEAFLDDNSPEQVEDLSNALKSASSFLDFLVNKTFDDKTEADEDIDVEAPTDEEVEEVLKGFTDPEEGLPEKDDRPDPFTESRKRVNQLKKFRESSKKVNLKESEENPVLPYSIVATYKDGTTDVLKTLHKSDYDAYYTIASEEATMEGLPSYEDLVDEDFEGDFDELSTLENFETLRKTVSEDLWDDFAADYFLMIVELVRDEKNGEGGVFGISSIDDFVEAIANMPNLENLQLFKNGKPMPVPEADEEVRDILNESVHKMTESEENPVLPYELIAVHADGTEEVIKTLDKEAFDEYYLYMDNFDGAPSYDDLYSDEDLEMDDAEEISLENFKKLREKFPEKAWDLFADDYYLTIAELANDEKNGAFNSNHTFDYEAVVDRLANMDDLIDFRLYKNGSEMSGVSHDIVMDLYSDIFTDVPKMSYVEGVEEAAQGDADGGVAEDLTESEKSDADKFLEGSPVRRTREALLEARKAEKGESLKEDVSSQIKYPAGSAPITSQIEQAEEAKRVQEAEEQNIITEYEKKIRERRKAVAEFRESIKQNRYRNTAAYSTSSPNASSRLNEALKGSMRLSDADKFDENTEDDAGSWRNNQFIDRYTEAKKLSFRDLTDRMNDHFFG